MAHTEKDLEIEGHTLPSTELLAEFARMLDLARAHAMVLRPHGYDLKNFTDMEQVKEMVLKEHHRQEGKPPKPFVPTKEQERLLFRAYQWRASMVRRADRVFHDDRYNRLKYHRNLALQALPERLYEELFWLLHYARLDLKKLGVVGVDQAFLGQGEDICFELQGTPAPNRKAFEEYEKAVKAYSGWGPEPEPPPPVPQLTPVVDNAKNLSVLRGRLYLMMRQLSATGQYAFCAGEKDVAKAEQVRREFVLRIRPQEDDEELVAFARFKGGATAAAVKAEAAKAEPPKATAEPAPAAPPAPPPRTLPMEQVTVKPGGPNPLPPTDPFKKPPPRAVGLVRPSPMQGNKREG